MGPSRPQGGLLDDIVPAEGTVDPDAVSIAMRLGRLGHVRGLVLHHLDFRVLVYLLGQSPGPYAGQLDTLAEACASDTTSVGGVQHLVEEAAELLPADLAALIVAIQSLPQGDQALPECHAAIAERIERVHAGGVATLSVDEVEQSLRRDLDF
jgi:hypothetical protein